MYENLEIDYPPYEEDLLENAADMELVNSIDMTDSIQTNNTEDEGDINMNNNEVVLGTTDTHIITKVEDKMISRLRDFDFRALSSKDLAEKQEILSNVATMAARQGRMGFDIIKKASKDIGIVNMVRAEFGIKYGKVDGKTNARIYCDTFVQPSMLSSLTRACNLEYGMLADKIMVAEGLYTTEVATVSLDKSLLNKTSKVAKRLFERVMSELFTTPISIAPLAKVTESRTLKIKFNTVTGVITKVDGIEALTKDEIIIEYEFLGITPSGLKSASMLMGATRKHTVDGVTNIDRRVEILEKAMDGAFSCNFLDEKRAFKTISKLEKLFKDSTRITQCVPGSQEIMDIENYLVVENIAKDAKFNGKAATTVTDGNTKVAGESLMDKYFRPNQIPVSLDQVVGTCGQYRGASLKCSSTVMFREDIEILAKSMISKDNFAFAVVDGVRLSKDEFLSLSFEEKERFYKKIDFLGDMNAFKLEVFNPVFKLVKLKEAYVSESDSNMVVNMAMLYIAPEEARELLVKRAKAQLIEQFGRLGAQFEVYEDGMPIPKSFTLDKEGGLNNASQFIDYLMNCDRGTIMKMMPGIFRSVMSNHVKGIRKMVNGLNIDIDSKYSVVQSDMAALFGETILQEDECFCKDFSVKKVSAVRHPISSIFAVSTFKTVTLEEVLNRIDKLNVGVSTKNAIARSYIFAKGYVILPASEYLMEKHDGMDWDIDAMQFILDQEVVAILERMPNIGSKISSENDWMRKETLNAEINIKNKVFIRPEVEKAAPEHKGDGVQSERAKAMARVQKSVNYNYGFDSISKYVARDFFSLDVANIGEIATAFYNNTCILSALRSKKTDESIKAAIVEEFKAYYSCSGEEEYKSVIIKRFVDGRLVYDMNKVDCCEAIFRFAGSNGTMEELCEFLMDCIYLNRYLAETSIDAAKNRYFIMNMLNHADIVRAQGSDKNMNIVITDDDSKDKADAIFANRHKALGLDSDANNFFGIEMLTAQIKGVSLSKLAAAREEAHFQSVITGRPAKPVALSVADPLGDIRLEIATFANDLIVLYTKLVEAEVTSLEAKELRRYIASEANKIDNITQINIMLKGISNSYATITTCIKEKDGDTFEDKAAKDYMGTVAIQACRNMAKLAFNDVDDYSIGLAVVNTLAGEKENTTLNPALIKIFEREIVAFLAAFGVNNVGTIGESLMYAKKDGKRVNIENYAGAEVIIESGKAYLEDGTVLIARDKKAKIEGVVCETENGYAVIGERKYTEDKLSAGAYFNYDIRSKEINGSTNCKGKFIPVSYELKSLFPVGKATYYNVVIAYNAEGQYKVMGSITANSNITAVLENMELNTSNFKVFTNANGRTVFFLGGTECEVILSAINSGDEFEGELVAPELDIDLDVNMVEPTVIEDKEFFYDMDSEFGLPQ